MSKIPFKVAPSPIVRYPSGSMNKIPYPVIKSYVRRQGRITCGQRRAIAAHWPSYGLSFTPQPINLQQVFGRIAPCVLEIGFGNGDSLITQAADTVNKDFIGVEMHTPGIGHILVEAEQRALRNLRIYQQDAIAVLSCCIAAQSLDKIQIFFPDPWPKRRHRKRRLLQPPIAVLLASRLKQGGILHCATDCLEYANQMMSVLSATPSLTNVAGQGQYFSEPYVLRPCTKFECRGLLLGHTISDLVFEKLTESWM